LYAEMYNNPADAARFNVDDFAAAFIRLEPGEFGDKNGIIVDFRIAWAMHVDTPVTPSSSVRRVHSAFLPLTAGTAPLAVL